MKNNKGYLSIRRSTIYIYIYIHIYMYIYIYMYVYKVWCISSDNFLSVRYGKNNTSAQAPTLFL